MRAVIVNPASASGRTEHRWRRIVDELQRDGEQVEVQLTTGPGDGIAIVRRLIGEGVRDIVVLGGDGTVGEVIGGCVRPDGSGMLADDIEISVIHQGTGGDYARSLGIPKDEAGAIATARTGTPRSVDVCVSSFTPRADIEHHGAVGEDGLVVRGFANCANVGLASEVVEMVTGRLKKLGNSAGFAIGAVTCMAKNRPRRVNVETEGVEATLDIVDIDICNNKYMGGGMLVAPDADNTDGKFDVVIVSAASRLQLIRTFPQIYKGTHVTHPLVRVEQTTHIAIGTPPDAQVEAVALDGELVGVTPARFDVIRGGVSVRVPVVEAAAPQASAAASTRIDA